MLLIELAERPWLALIPAVFFLLFFRFSRERLVGGVGLAWLIYACYEYSMYRRWLCTGECNIRIDLLLIHPILVLTSVAALVVGVRSLLRSKQAGA